MPTPGPKRSLLGPTIGTIIFVLLMPGTVIGVIPFLLTRWRLATPLFGLSATRWIGAALFGLATPLFADFVVRFVREGRGTPAPIAPTQQLVVGGPFRVVRNPGYVSVAAMLLGQGLFFGNAAVLLYTIGITTAFHLFVVFHEEPTLRRQFGQQYVDYCRRVPRWWPGWRPRTGGISARRPGTAAGRRRR